MIEHVLLANEGTEGRTGSETQAPDVSVTMDTETSDMIHEWLEQAFNEADKDGAAPPPPCELCSTPRPTCYPAPPPPPLPLCPPQSSRRPHPRTQGT